LITLIDVGASFLEMWLSKLHSQLPAQVVAAVQAAIDALIAHKNDLMTKAEWESQRG
jgi:hypothetical protein